MKIFETRRKNVKNFSQLLSNVAIIIVKSKATKLDRYQL